MQNLVPKFSEKQNAVVTIVQSSEEDDIVVYTIKNESSIDVYSLFLDMKNSKNLRFVGYEFPEGKDEPLAAFQQGKETFTFALAGTEPVLPGEDIVSLKFRRIGTIDDV